MDHRLGPSPAVLAGIVTGVVGFTSSFAVVIAGLQAVGASGGQASSGLMVLCLSMGLGCIIFAVATRQPVTIAWSTPGAALLASALTPHGGFAVAIGAFVLTGLLLALTGFVRPLAHAVAAIPDSIASAMLAGVLLSLCVAPFRDLPKSPWAIGGVLLTWLALNRIAPRWAVPGSLVAAIIAMAGSGAFQQLNGDLLPHLEWTTPRFEGAAIIAITLPLYVVTMTSQNIPGVTVMKSLGYDVPLRPVLGYTGLATALGAPLGGHAINLSAIAAALAAGPEAGPDKDRRWLAAVTTGISYIAFGLAAQAVVALAAAAPTGLFAAIAGVALFSSFAAAAAKAFHVESHRLAAAVTFVIASSGLSLWGIGSAFWALLAGVLLVRLSNSSLGRSLSQ